MEWNAESVLDALNDFERKSEIPEILDQYLERIAKNGEIVFPWNKLKPLLKKKLEFVLDEFYETYPVETSVPVPNFETFNFDNLKKTILQAVDAFTSAPFTIQRLCELVTNPTKHYNRTDKYMRGIEKNVLVVSTIEPRSELGDGVNANNPVVNGVLNDSPRDDNDTLNGHESSDSVSSSSNLNTASNHVLLENFANVFPSAACIPPSSNICVDREDVDNNFMATSDNVEEESAPVEQIESTVSKDEEMDTREDESDRIDVEHPQTADMKEETSIEDATEEVSDSVDAESESDSSLEPASAETSDSDNSSENIKSEAECSVSKAESDVADKDAEKKSVCQQDDTVSQSDDSSRISTEVSPTNEVVDYIKEVASDIKLDDYIENVGDDVGKESKNIAQPLQEDVLENSETNVVSENDSTSEPSGMELESTTSSDEPDPPV